MKMSMYMVERWLTEADYETVSTITSGKREITSARLYEDAFAMDRHCLYVMVDSQEGQTQTLVVNGNDVISVNSDDASAIFNEVLNAFDFYHDLELQLSSAMVDPNPGQKCIDLCGRFLGPTFLVAPDFSLIGVSKRFVDADVTWFWDDMSSQGEMPANLIVQIAKSTTAAMMEDEPIFQPFREPYAYPYEYGIMHTCRELGGNPVGFLVVASNEEITPFELDIAQVLADALDDAYARTDSFADRASLDAQGLIAQLSSENQVGRAELYIRSRRNLPGNVRFRVVSSAPMEPRLLPRLARELESLLPSAIVGYDSDRITALVWSIDDAGVAKVESQLRYVAKLFKVHFGESNRFTRLEAFRFYRKQAEHAADEVGGKRLASFDDIALDYLVNAQEAQERWYARHPALFSLEEEGEEVMADMIDTLRCYLLCGKSVNRVAEMLHVHKNTVLYRVRQLQERASFDLDDDEERAYLFVSLLVR